ncbi:hypothetical protein PM082_014254 [Marasmius tenuissimus]|nr:hypothetical protein PM082_014254 [Marasmius tenuissimus]
MPRKRIAALVTRRCARPDTLNWEHPRSSSCTTTVITTMPEDNGIPLKKRRLQNAWDECKRQKGRLDHVREFDAQVIQHRKSEGDSAKMPGNVCTTCLAYGTECTHVLALSQKKHGPPKGTPRGTKTVQSIAKSILSTSRPYVVPGNQEDTLRILKDLARRVVDLEEQLEAFKKREHDRQNFATTTPDSSVTSESSRTPMITHYTPAYTPTYAESENEGQVSGDETSTMNLVKAVVNQLAISTPAPAHLQTSKLAQYLREPDSTSDGDLAPCGNSMGRQGLSVPARPKRKEFWDTHSW